MAKQLGLNVMIRNLVVNMLKPCVIIVAGVKLKNVHFTHLQYVLFDVNDAITHQQSAGIYTKNYFRTFFQ